VIVGLTDLSYGGTALDLDGKEADILALLSVARRGLAPAEMLAKLAAASRALIEGDISRAAIALALTGQPALTDEALAKSLTFAANRLKRGMRPFDLLKSARLVPLGMSHDDWLKTVGATTSPISSGSNAASNSSTPGWDEDLHPRGEDGKFVESGSAGGDAKGVQVADNRPANTMSDVSSVDGDKGQSPYDETKALTVSNVNSYVEAHNGKGRVGDGECVTLVKDATGDHDSARDTWVAGPLLSADPSNEQAGTVNPADIKPGTAIAIFGSDGRYHNVHAAIFVKYDKDTHEVVVFDQWAHRGGEPAERRYLFNPPKWKAPIDNAGRYSIIQKR